MERRRRTARNLSAITSGPPGDLPFSARSTQSTESSPDHWCLLGLSWSITLSCQVGGDGVGGVAVQAVAGMVVPAGRAGVLVAGVVLHIAQGSPGVQGEGDRRVAQAVRREVLPRSDPGGAGQAAYQLPQMALAEPPAGGGGQQRSAQLPPLSRPGPLRPVGQVCLQGRDRGRGERDLRLRAPLRTTRRTRWPESSPRSAMSAAQASSTRRALCSSSRTTAAVRSAWAPASASAAATRALAWSRSQAVIRGNGYRSSPSERTLLLRVR